jgi:hypothetical protein
MRLKTEQERLLTENLLKMRNLKETLSLVKIALIITLVSGFIEIIINIILGFLDLEIWNWINAILSVTSKLALYTTGMLMVWANYDFLRAIVDISEDAEEEVESEQEAN